MKDAGLAPERMEAFFLSNFAGHAFTGHNHLAPRSAHASGLDFISAPFDLERLELLDGLDVPAIKIASGDLTFEPMVRAAARTGRPILLSTGMAEVDEIVRTVQAIREEGSKSKAAERLGIPRQSLQKMMKRLGL